MAKINPYALRPVENKTETKTFTDPRLPDVPVSFTLYTGFNLGRELSIQQIAIDLNRRFVLGTRHEETGEIIQEAMPPVGNVTPTLDSLHCQKYARLLGQQVPGENAYNFLEIAALSVTLPEALWEAIMWAERLAQNVPGVKDQLKKPLPETPKSTSEPRLTDAPDTTLNS